MKPDQSRTRLKTLYAALAAGAISMSVLVACGGGGGGTSSGSTTTSTSGPISGFGSIIVNGTRIDDSTAQITLDDDSSGKDADLKLGMMVDVDADADANGNPGKASAVSARSFVEGPISAISTVNNQLTVLGVTVTVTASTVFDGATGLAALNVGDGIEVYGVADASGNVRATRIEGKASAISDVRVTGIVQSADSTSITINGVKITYLPANLVNLPTGVTTGMLVRVKGTLSGSIIVASKIRAVHFGPNLNESQRAEVDGVVTAFTSATNFAVDGVLVSVPATVTAQGTVALGVRVEIKGQVVNNVLVASKVEVQDETQELADAYEMHGLIFSIDAANKTLTMRDGAVTIKWDSNTTFDVVSLPSGAAGLTAGLRVEVKGKMVGNVLIATIIQLDK